MCDLSLLFPVDYAGEPDAPAKFRVTSLTPGRCEIVRDYVDRSGRLASSVVAICSPSTAELSLRALVRNLEENLLSATARAAEAAE